MVYLAWRDQDRSFGFWFGVGLIAFGCAEPRHIEIPVPCPTPCLDLPDGGDLAGWDSGWTVEEDDRARRRAP